MRKSSSTPTISGSGGQKQLEPVDTGSWHGLAGFREVRISLGPLGASLQEDATLAWASRTPQFLSVVPGSDAELAGLKPGDRILELNGKSLEKIHAAVGILGLKKVVLPILEQRPLVLLVARRGGSAPAGIPKELCAKPSVAPTRPKRSITIEFTSEDEWPLGLELRWIDGPPIVIKASGPALERGARTGDAVMRVNKRNTRNSSWREILNEFRAPIVSVRLERPEPVWPQERTAAQLLGTWNYDGVMMDGMSGEFQIIRDIYDTIWFHHCGIREALTYSAAANAWTADLDSASSVMVQPQDETTLITTFCGVDTAPVEPPLKQPQNRLGFPGGWVNLTIVEAEDLPVMDMAFVGEGKADPYVKVFAGGERQVFRTAVVQKCLYPVWNASCRFRVSRDEAYVILRVFDEDKTSGDDPMGFITLWLADLASAAEGDSPAKMEILLESPEKGRPPQGIIHIEVSFEASPPRPPFRGGILEMVIVEAENLPAMDKAMLGKGSSDPYVRVLAGGQREVFRTEVVEKSLSPIWEASCTCSVTPKDECVVFGLFDQDLTSGDDSMGSARLWVEDLEDDEAADLWLTVEPDDECPQASGMIHVQVTFHLSPLRQPFRGGFVTLCILEATGLLASDPAIGKGGTSDPYVQVLAAGRREVHRTKVLDKTLDPVWNELAKFRVSRDEEDLMLVVFDQDTSSGDDCLGGVTLSLPLLSGIGGEAGAWLRLEPDKRCPQAKGHIYVQVNFQENPLRVPFRGAEVQLVVVEATGLAAMDVGMRQGTSDPYVKVLVSGRREILQTDVQKETLSPVWDALCTFQAAGDEEFVTFQIFDRDAMSADDLMGTATLWISDLRGSGWSCSDLWLPLETSNDCEKTQGQLHVRVWVKEAPPQGRIAKLARKKVEDAPIVPVRKRAPAPRAVWLQGAKHASKPIVEYPAHPKPLRPVASGSTFRILDVPDRHLLEIL